MTEDSNDDSSTELSEQAYHMLTDSQLNQVQSGRRFSGDGPWTEAHIICALVDGQNEDEALAKAAAAFAHRDGRPEPLFDHSKTDTFDLASELESLPLAVTETPWADRKPIARLSTDEADAALEQIHADSDFESGESIVYDVWGDEIQSEAELTQALDGLGDDGWIVVGVGLKPTGAGEQNEDYIGSIYEIHCMHCNDLKPAECVNIVYDDIHDSHDGVWTCEDCGTNFRGVHPRGPAGTQSETSNRP